MLTRVTSGMTEGLMSREDGASQIGLVYLGEWKAGLVIPKGAQAAKLAVWHDGQFYSVTSDAGFTSKDFDADLAVGRFKYVNTTIVAGCVRNYGTGGIPIGGI